MGAPAIVPNCPACGAGSDPVTAAVLYVPNLFQCWKCGKRRCERCGKDTGAVLISHCTACQRDVPDPPDNDPYTPAPRSAPVSVPSHTPRTAARPRKGK